MNLTTLIGLVAALFTTISYFPQLKKCWDTGSANDLSLKMFSILAAGIALWIVYGWFNGDLVIVVANTVSFMLLMGILSFKLREGRGPPRPVRATQKERPTRRGEAARHQNPTYPPPPMQGLAPTLDRNIEALKQRRLSEERSASWQERVADRITRFTGSMIFVYIHLAIFGFWIMANLHLVVEPQEVVPGQAESADRWH